MDGQKRCIQSIGHRKPSITTTSLSCRSAAAARESLFVHRWIWIWDANAKFFFVSRNISRLISHQRTTRPLPFSAVHTTYTNTAPNQFGGPPLAAHIRSFSHSLYWRNCNFIVNETDFSHHFHTDDNGDDVQSYWQPCNAACYTRRVYMLSLDRFPVFISNTTHIEIDD